MVLLYRKLIGQDKGASLGVPLSFVCISVKLETCGCRLGDGCHVWSCCARPRSSRGKPQKACTGAKNIRRRMGIGGSHPTHTCLKRNQELKCMRSAYGQAAYLKIPTASISWAYALRIRSRRKSTRPERRPWRCHDAENLH